MKIPVNYTKISYFTLNTFIALVWFINGLFCKILNLVPRHKEIVAVILKEEYASVFTITIGILEVLMAVWILSDYFKRLNTYIQIIVIGIMNILEFIMVPHLLLWGKLNIFFALLFLILIYINYSKLYLKIKQQ